MCVRIFIHIYEHTHIQFYLFQGISGVAGVCKLGSRVDAVDGNGDLNDYSDDDYAATWTAR